MGEYSGTLSYFENVGSASAPAYSLVSGAASPFDGIAVSGDSAPAFADLDDDGDWDLVVGEYNGVLDY